MADPYYTGPLVAITAFQFGGAVVTITAGTDVSVLAQAISQLGPKFLTAKKITVKVTGPVTHLLWSSPASWALFGSPVERFKLINQSTIYGKGGEGGHFVNIGAAAVAGAAGGPALELNGWAVSLNNAAGNIWGGGGGGGASGGVDAFSDLSGPTGPGGPGGANTTRLATTIFGRSGGGGSGGVASSGGTGTGFQASATLNDGTPQVLTDTTGTLTNGTYSLSINAIGTDGQAGGLGGPGAGGTPSDVSGSGPRAAASGTGGAGGDFGEAGQNGGAASSSFASNTFRAGSNGGAAGKAVDLAGGSVTWLAGNEPERVKGAVS